MSFDYRYLYKMGNGNAQVYVNYVFFSVLNL